MTYRDFQKSFDSKEELKNANDRRIEEIKNINNKFVRTQRHLEQYQDISDPDSLNHSEIIQEQRQERMDNLKNIVAHGKHEEINEVENIDRKIEYTDNYIENHKDNMDQKTLNDTKTKQKHRKEQKKFLQ